jgi:hypothetical protein
MRTTPSRLDVRHILIAALRGRNSPLFVYATPKTEHCNHVIRAHAHKGGLLLKCLFIGESSTEEVAIRGVSSVVDVLSEGDGVLVTEHQRESIP